MENLELNRSIIIIDKPEGPTSFQVTDFVKKSLQLNKASHFGTLDPKVTGVLPVALGRASRLTGYFSRQDKEYVGIMHMHEKIAKQKIEKIIKEKFLGRIKQLPPVKSRVKRELRERQIKKFEILEQDKNDFLFKVECEAGTYIRKLVHDLGQELNVNAHMTELRRTRASIFREKDAVTLYQFTEAVQEFKKGRTEKLSKMLFPMEIITKIMPSIEIKTAEIKKILHGFPIYKEALEKYENFSKNDFVAVMHKGMLIEIAQAEISSDEIKNANTIAKPKTIFN